MPQIYLEIDKVYEECSSREKEQLIELLIDDDLIKDPDEETEAEDERFTSDGTYSTDELITALAKISDARLQLTVEEEDQIKTIANKYR